MNSNKEYYFISGLPRSGSTLLSAILRQNPDFYADISSPLEGMLTNCIGHMTSTETSANISNERREAVLKGITDGYYSEVDRPVVFDSCRGWTSQTNLLKAMYPYTKMICCVRDINWILDSFEKISNKNPYHMNTLAHDETSPCVHTRSHSLMDINKSGTVIKPWYWLQEGLLANPDMILLVEYNDLTQDPEGMMRRVYDFIGKDYYENHDYENVEYSNEPFDLGISVPNLHTVSGRVEYRERETVLPHQITEKYANYEFWRKNTNTTSKPKPNLLYD